MEVKERSEQLKDRILNLLESYGVKENSHIWKAHAIRDANDLANEIMNEEIDIYLDGYRDKGNLFLYTTYMEALKEYERHIPEKDHTWVDMEMETLRKILMSVYEKWIERIGRFSGQEEADELIDMIVVAAMIYERLTWKAHAIIAEIQSKRGDRDENNQT